MDLEDKYLNTFKGLGSDPNTDLRKALPV